MTALKIATASFVLVALTSACSTTSPMIADKSLLISPSVEITYEALAGAAVAAVVVWYFADPMAPTWGVARRKLAEDRYRIDLRQKRFAVNGDGEAQQVFHRAAETLAEENGYAGYIIVSYSEGLESGPLLSQRVSRGVILLTGNLTAFESR